MIWMPVPESYVFPKRDGYTGRLWVVLHKTADPDSPTAQDVAQGFITDTKDMKSAHYVIGRDGTVVQCVSEENGAGANCCLQEGHAPYWPDNLNLNVCTISIEHVDTDPHNATPITEEQKKASFQLVGDICDRHNIPARPADEHGGVAGHKDMRPGDRAHCPGNYPWDELWAYLKERNTMPVVNGEVVAVNQADQFQPARSQFECGFYAVFIARSMAKLGQSPALSPAEISAKAQDAYARYDGDNSIYNTAGMSNQQLYDLLHEVGLHYQATDLDTALIRAWLRQGFPVIVGVPETSVHDLELGDRVPYPWNPSGNHVFLLTGLKGNNFLAHDSANVTDLYNPNTLRPGPRCYDASLLQYVSATVVIPPWRDRPGAGYDPRKEPLPVQVPEGWQDENEVLLAPNGKKVVKGFRSYVLNFSGGWRHDDLPLTDEAQSEQPFESRILKWTPKDGVYEEYIVAELLKLRADASQPAVPLAALHSDLVTLANTLAPFSQASGVVTDLLSKLGK